VIGDGWRAISTRFLLRKDKDLTVRTQREEHRGKNTEGAVKKRRPQEEPARDLQILRTYGAAVLHPYTEKKERAARSRPYKGKKRLFG